MQVKQLIRFASLACLTVFVTSVFAITKPVTTKVNKAVTTTPAKTVYTQDQPNILVPANASRFVIKLESNPTTGYSWFLHEYDENIIQPVKHEYKSGDKTVIGSSGYELWTFVVKPEGLVVPQQTSIRFVYARPWEGSDNSTQIVFHVSTLGK